MGKRRFSSPIALTALLAAAALVLGGASIAAQPGGHGGGRQKSAQEGQKQPGTPPKSDASVRFIASQQPSQILASSVLDMHIENKSGDGAQTIGTVNDLILDKDRRLVGIVVGVGGFLGMGQKNVGIPWSAVENIDPQKRVAVVDVTKDQLKAAPAFATKKDLAHMEKQKKPEAGKQESSRPQPAASTAAPGSVPVPAKGSDRGNR